MLGIEWLQTLGLVTSDFSTPCITFHHQGQPITLMGQLFPTSQLASPTQLAQIPYMDAISFVYLLCFQPSSLTAHTTPLHPLFLPSNIPQPFQDLLIQRSSLFVEPKGPPPPCPHNHYIPFISHSSPVTSKPYYYPHAHKEVMGKLIQDMLQEGFI